MALNVGETQADQAGLRDRLGDALDALAQHVVHFHEGLFERRLAIDDLEQPIVRNGDQRVDALLELDDALVSVLGPLVSLESERLGHHADSQRAELL